METTASIDDAPVADARVHARWGITPGMTETEVIELLCLRRNICSHIEERRRKHENRETARLRRLAKEHGYEGQCGGWIYRRIRSAGSEALAGKTTWRLVTQGWRAFERLCGAKIGFVRTPFSPCVHHEDCRASYELGRACVFAEYGLESG